MSENSELIDMIQCAVSKNEKHFLIHPIQLPCVHSICKDCIPASALVSKNSQVEIKCYICGAENQLNLSKTTECLKVKQLFKANYKSFYEAIRTTYEKSLEKLTESIEITKNRLRLQIEFAKEEIEIRIESIKMQLEEISENLMQKLDIKETDFLKIIDGIDPGSFEISIQESNINIDEKSVVWLNRLQEKTRDIENVLEYLKNIGVKFNTNDQLIDSSLIGTIDFNSDDTNLPLFDRLSIHSRLKSNHFDYVDLQVRSTDSCVIKSKGSSSSLLTANFRDKNLTLFNENFELIQKIDKLKEIAQEPFAITTNQINRIYLCDRENHHVSILDYDLNVLSSIGKCGTKSYQFQYPRGIEYSIHTIYICDWQNKRIEIYTDDLVYKRTFRLNYFPIQVKISDISRTMCVRCEKSGIYFYDIDSDLQLTHYYDTHNGAICVINDYFYEFCPKNMKFYFYNEFGKLIDESDLKLKNESIKTLNINEWATLVYFNQKFIIIPESDTKCIVF